MDKYEIAHMVRHELTYKTGWTFHPVVADSYSADVIVLYEAHVPNSSPADVDPRPFVVTTGRFVVKPGPREYVEDQIMQEILAAEDHETREFVRFNGRAPYHPHREDGQVRWNTRDERTVKARSSR